MGLQRYIGKGQALLKPNRGDRKMKSVSIRIEPVSAKTYNGHIRENFRDKVPNYVDGNKKHLNINSARPDGIENRVIEQGRETGRTVRKDARVSYAGIITFSHEAQDDIRNLDESSQVKIYNDIARAISEKTNADLLYLTIHNDETAPHAHFMLKPYDNNGKALRLNPNDLSRLQDTAGEILEKNGLDIHRGKPKTERIRDGDHPNQIYNRSVQQLHEDLPREIETLQKQAFEYYEKAKKNYDYLEKSQTLARNASANNEKIQKRIDIYQRREKDAREAAESAEKEIEQKLKILEVLEKNEKLQDQVIRLTTENQKLKAMVTEHAKVKRLKLS
jgi:hypothetical protein